MVTKTKTTTKTNSTKATNKAAAPMAKATTKSPATEKLSQIVAAERVLADANQGHRLLQGGEDVGPDQRRFAAPAHHSGVTRRTWWASASKLGCPTRL